MTDLAPPTAQAEFPAIRSAAAASAANERAIAVRRQTDKEQRRLRVERAATLKRWGHKRNGTPETHEAHRRRQDGAIARLHASGYLDDLELAISQQIQSVAELIAADVTPRTANLEGRVDRSRHGDAFDEALTSVWREMAYSRWRAEIGPKAAALALDIIVRDIGIARAAAGQGMHVRKARRLLTEALATWSRNLRAVRKEVSAADLLAAQAGLL